MFNTAGFYCEEYLVVNESHISSYAESKIKDNYFSSMYINHAVLKLLNYLMNMPIEVSLILCVKISYSTGFTTQFGFVNVVTRVLRPSEPK